MKKLKILQVNKLYFPYIGGIEKVVQQIAEGLNDQTDMKVLVCQDKGIGLKEKINNVKVYRSPSLGLWGNLPFPYRFSSDLKKLSKDRDIIHVHMPFPFADMACLLSGYKGKIIVWWHSDIVRQKKLMKFYRPIMKQFLKRADKIIVATEGHIKGSAELRGFREKCVIVPFGVDREVEKAADQYVKLNSSQYDTRSDDILGSINIEENQISNTKQKEELIRFLFVGRLVYYKGCKHLLEAFSNLRGKVELNIVGTGPLEDELKEMAIRLGIKSKVHFHGSVTDDELYKCYEKCDVFVLPSIEKSEAFGLVQLEAMIYGKPVINTWLPSGVPYVSIHKETGLTVKPKNISELEKAMRWMQYHPLERQEMGQKARKRVKEVYNMDYMLDKVMEVYEEVESGI